MASGRPIAHARRVRVLIVDDSAKVRDRLSALLRADSSTLEIWESADLARSRQLLLTAPVDVVVLDVRLGAHNGMDFIGEVKRHQPGALVVILTNDSSEAYRRAATARGADFFLDKSQEFERALEVVALCGQKLARSAEPPAEGGS